MKLVTWLPTIVATIFGILEAVLKFLKEVLTLIVSILFPIIPNNKFKAFVTKMRALIDKGYDVISKAKESILKWVGVI
jgi:hypothetical protein